jgi:hypothetical protein
MVLKVIVLDLEPLGKIFYVMKITLSFRWWQPCVNNNSMSTSCITRCIKSSSTMRRWHRSALNSSMTTIVGKPWRNVIFDNVFSISSNNGWRIPKQYNILSGGWFAYICLTCCKILYTNRVLPLPVCPQTHIHRHYRLTEIHDFRIR